MTIFRQLLMRRRLAGLICAVALLLKLLVPAGYMIDRDHDRITVTLCSGLAPHTMAVAMPEMQGDMPGHGKAKDHGKAEMPCAFSGLLAAVTGAIDPIQLAALIAFVTALGFAAILPFTLAERARLRPPLRGPPATL